mmetsp:Transcript_7962/g.32768  ORF Transcript_7962/g.32768 Transcript_7962/m.32768 type:complete len:361 (-) Transcript_7962:20-1102(-)
MPRVDGQTDDPLGVPQRAASEEDVGRNQRDLLAPRPILGGSGEVAAAPVDGNLPRPRRDVQVPRERVQRVIRVFALHVSVASVAAQLAHLRRAGAHASHALDAPLDLQVRLAVQVFGLDVAHAVVQAGREEHQIARERLVPHDPHQISRLHLPPLALHQRGAVETLRQRRVLLVVLLVPGVILHSLLRHGQPDDQHERRPDGVRLDRGDGFEERDYRDGEEVKVGDPPELFVQALWEEGDGRVLAGGDGVALEPEPRVGAVRAGIRGDVNHPRLRVLGVPEAERVHPGRHLFVVPRVLARVILGTRPLRPRGCDPPVQDTRVPYGGRPTGRERPGLSRRGSLDRCFAHADDTPARGLRTP